MAPPRLHVFIRQLPDCFGLNLTELDTVGHPSLPRDNFDLQTDTQVELMEDLADEMILDTVLKDAFFSTGDIYFELARRLERTVNEAAAASSVATASATAAAAAGERGRGGGREGAGGGGVEQRVLDGGRPDRNFGGGRASRRSTGTDVRLLAATAAVFDAAFFHSMQLPQKMDIFMISTPMALPKIADMFVYLYCNVKRRWLGKCSSSFGGGGGDDGWSGGDVGGGDLAHGDSRKDLCIPSPRTPPNECDAGGERAPVEPETRGAHEIFSRRRRKKKRTLDFVVRALNGISDVSRVVVQVSIAQGGSTNVPLRTVPDTYE